MFKEYFSGKKLITFDLDGTTVKSSKAWYLSFMEVAKSVDLVINSTGTGGTSVFDRWEQIIKEQELKTTHPVKLLTDMTYNEYQKHLDMLELTEGFWPFVGELKLIKKMPLALVTSTPRMLVEQVIEKLELKEVYDFVICGDEVKKPKPDAEIYRKTLDHFKVSPKETLAFEDSLTGCVSAVRAGIKVVCVWDGKTPQRKFPDEVIGFTADFTPFPGEMDTSYYEDLERMAKEEKEKEQQNG